MRGRGKAAREGAAVGLRGLGGTEDGEKWHRCGLETSEGCEGSLGQAFSETPVWALVEIRRRCPGVDESAKLLPQTTGDKAGSAQLGGRSSALLAPLPGACGAERTNRATALVGGRLWD